MSSYPLSIQGDSRHPPVLQGHGSVVLHQLLESCSSVLSLLQSSSIGFWECVAGNGDDLLLGEALLFLDEVQHNPGVGLGWQTGL